MTVYDLFLVAVVLALAAALVFALGQAFVGKFRESLHTLRTAGLGLAIYVATVALVGLTAPQKVLAVGAESCNDDWCVSPTDVREEVSELRIDFKVWSRARRATQREFGVHPFLLDEKGQRIEPVRIEGAPFEREVAPNESFVTTRFYRVDPRAVRLDLVMRSGISPALFVINESQSLFHKPAVYRIKPAL